MWQISCLTFEGEQFRGQGAISQKLSGLPFQSVAHEVISADCQPAPGGCIIVMVYVPAFERLRFTGLVAASGGTRVLRAGTKLLVCAGYWEAEGGRRR